MPENLDQVAAPAAEHIEIAGMRVALQTLLHLDRQAVHAAPHVGVPDRQPHPHTGRNRDHRRDSALTTAAASAAGVEAGIRTRVLPANSTSITGSAYDASTAFGAGSPADAINICANPSATARNSCRQRQIWPAQTSARRATSLTTAPGARLSATIDRFCSSDQRRRRSAPVITSTRAIAPSLALVQAPSFAPILTTSPEPMPQCKAALTGRLRSSVCCIRSSPSMNRCIVKLETAKLRDSKADSPRMESARTAISRCFHTAWVEFCRSGAGASFLAGPTRFVETEMTRLAGVLTHHEYRLSMVTSV